MYVGVVVTKMSGKRQEVPDTLSVEGFFDEEAEKKPKPNDDSASSTNQNRMI